MRPITPLRLVCAFPALAQRMVAVCSLVLATWLPLPWLPQASAQWTDVATISNTLTNTPGRLCVGGGRTDIGCPTTAPMLDSAAGLLTVPGNLRIIGNLYVSGSQSFDGVTFANGGVSATGTISATNFSGNGSGITGIDFSANPVDRIISGTAAVIAQQAGTVGLTLGGTANAAYFHPTIGFVGPGVSTTGPVSATALYLQPSGIGGYGQLYTNPASFANGFGFKNDGNDSTFAAMANNLYLGTYRSNTASQEDIVFFHQNATSTTTSMFLRGTDGFVGIGTQAPNAKLEVRGDISATNLRLSGNLYVSGSQSIDGVVFANGGVSATGAVTATSFAGDGSRLTGVVASNVDWYNISNVPSQVQAVSNGTAISMAGISSTNVSVTNNLTVGGAATVGSLGAGAINANSISTTGLSATSLVAGTGRINGDLTVTGNLNVSGSQVIDGVIFANGGVSATGAVTATSFAGDGSGLTGLNFSANPLDRIISGTSAVIAQQGGTVSLTLGGVAGAAYFHPTLGYVGPGVSTTGGVSGSTGYFNTLGVGAPANLSAAAAVISTSTANILQLERNGGTNANRWKFTVTGNSANGVPNGSLALEPQDQNGGFSVKDINNNFIWVLNSSNNNMYMPNGRISIGLSPTTTASTALHVSGTIRIANGGEACDANRTGAMRFTGGEFYICRNGTAWESLTDIANNAASQTDRITSGTTNVFANQSGSISFTVAGVTTGYFHNGQLVANGVSTTGGISGSTLYGGRLNVAGNSILTDTSATNVSVTNNLTVGGSLIGTTASVNSLAANTVSTGLISATNASITLADITTLRTGNISATGNVSVTGNVSANRFIGDGSLLTNISASAITGLTADRITSGTTSVIAYNNASATIATAGIERLIVGTNGNIGMARQPSPDYTVAISASVVIDGTNGSQMVLNGPAGTFRMLSFNTSNLRRWEINADHGLEWGGNNGSDLYFNRYADNGAPLDSSLVIKRSTGYMGVGTENPSTSLHVSGTLRIANGGESCDTNRLGAIRYTSGQFQVCRNTTTGWETLTAGSAVGVTTFASLTDVSVSVPVGSIYGPGSNPGPGGNNTDGNTSFGSTALSSGAIAGGNLTAFGYGALQSVTTGSDNTAIGSSAMEMTVDGADNTAVGMNALYYNVSGGSNVAIGNYSLMYTTADLNTSVGSYALNQNVSGTRNVAMGFQALGANFGNSNVGIGTYSGLGMTTGASNTFVGYSAGSNLTSGNSNIFLGRDTTAAVTNGSNQLNIGNAIRGNIGSGNGLANLIGINVNSPTTALQVSGTVSATRFVGDGSLLTNISASAINGLSAERITSGTLAVTTNSVTSVVSLSTAGTTWGYFSSVASYLPNLYTNLISATTVSATNISATNLTASAVTATTLATTNISATGNVSVTGNVSANRFIGDGSLLTGISASNISGLSTDRITSGTTSVITYNNTSATIATSGVERLIVGTDGNVGIAQQPEQSMALSVSGSVGIIGHLNLGQRDMFSNFSNVTIGKGAGTTAPTLRDVVAIGTYAANNNAGSYNVAIGSYAASNNLGTNVIAVGYGAAGDNLQNNVIAIGSGTASQNVLDNVIAIGNTAASQNAGPFVIALGGESAAYNTGGYVTAIGELAAQNNMTSGTTAYGHYSLAYNMAGLANTATGYQTLMNTESGSYNTALGYAAGQGVSGNSFSANTLIGSYTGTALTTGSSNTIVGANSGMTLTTGARNILLGNAITTPAATTSDYLSIGNAIFGNIASGLGYANRIGINVPAPTVALEVSGTISATNITAGAFTLPTVSGSSGISMSSPGDNLGDHTATQNLAMGGFNITGVNSISASGNVSVTGNVSANRFIGDGSLLTNISASAITGLSAERIISGTTAVTANSTTAIVSLSTAGTTWGYLGSLASYLPNFSSNAISTSNISVTTINGAPVSSLGTTDRITSGTTAVTANTATNTVSITTAGTTTSYFHGTLGLVTPGVSSTGPISGTNGYFDGELRATGDVYGNRFFGAELWLANDGYIHWSNDVYVVGNGINKDLRFGTNNADAMVITSNSFVGIGTSTPTAELEVSGTVSATRFVGDGSLLTGIGSGDRITSGTTSVIANENGPVTISATALNVGTYDDNGDPDTLYIGLRTGENPVSGTLAIGHYAANNNTGLDVTAFGNSSALSNTGWGITAIGRNATEGNTGSYITAIGANAAQANTGDNVTAVGQNAANSNSGQFVTAIGENAAEVNTAINVVAIGYYAGLANTGVNLTAIGNTAATNNTGNYVTAIGNTAASNNIGNYVTAVGRNAVVSNSGSYVNAFGRNAAYSNTGQGVNAMGRDAAYNNTANEVTAIGTYAAEENQGAGVIAIGNNAAASNIGEAVYAIGSSAARNNTASSVVSIGNNASQNNSGYSHIGIGEAAGSQNTGSYLIGIGSQAGIYNTGNFVIAIGPSSAALNTVTGTIAIGNSALISNASGLANTAIGYEALFNTQTGSYNTALGYATGTGSSGNSFSANTLIGSYTGTALTTGSSNTIVGANSGMTLTTGGNNILLGAELTTPAATTSNYLSIGNAIFGDIASGLGYDNRIGINVAAPTTALEVSGTISATAITINGVPLSGGGGSSDRITSGTTHVIANGTTGRVDISGSLDIATMDRDGFPYNMFVGRGAGLNNSGSSVLGLGLEAAKSNTGIAVTAIGQSAAENNTGYEVTALGEGAALGNGGNTVIAVGNQAAQWNTGNDIVAIGSSAATNNTASFVTAVGTAAAESNTSSGTTAVGYYSLRNNTGLANTATGYQSMRYKEAGNYNSAFGYNAGLGDGTSVFSANTLLGSYTGTALTTGSSNTIVGANSGMTLTTGERNILIGAGLTTPAATTSDYLSIGNAIFGDIASGLGYANRIGINTAAPSTSLHVSGTTTTNFLQLVAVPGSAGVSMSSGGSGGSAGPTDRISTTGVASGSGLAMVVAGNGTVSFTLGGTAGAAYLHPTLGFVGPGVSTTGPISGTAVATPVLRLLGVSGSAGVSMTSGGSADNLGNHTATQALTMGGFNITGAAVVSASGTIKTTAALQAGNTDTTCSSNADYGKIRFDSVTRRAFLCRP